MSLGNLDYCREDFLNLFFYNDILLNWNFLNYFMGLDFISAWFQNGSSDLLVHHFVDHVLLFYQDFNMVVNIRLDGFLHDLVYVVRFLNDLFHSLFDDSLHGVDDDILNGIVDEFLNYNLSYNSILDWLLDDHLVRLFHDDFFDYWSFNYHFIALFDDVLVDDWIFSVNVNMTIVSLSGLFWFMLQGDVFGQGFHYCIGISCDIFLDGHINSFLKNLLFVYISDGLGHYLVSHLSLGLDILEVLLL